MSEKIDFIRNLIDFFPHIYFFMESILIIFTRFEINSKKTSINLNVYETLKEAGDKKEIIFTCFKFNFK